MYGSSRKNEATQLFPPPTAQTANRAQAPCTLYYDKNGTQPASAGSDFYVNAYCISSCYTPEQEILFSDGYDGIQSALDKLRTDLVTLDESSTLNELKYRVNGVRSYTAEIRDTEHLIFEIRTASEGVKISKEGGHKWYYAIYVVLKVISVEESFDPSANWIL